MKASLSALAAAILLAGCATLEPKYEQPVAPVPAQWPAASVGNAPTAAETVLPEWRTFFADQKLSALIDIALKENRDLRVAALNIERARAAHNIQRAALIPGIDGSVAGAIQDTPATGTGQVARQYSANVGVTSFELDFFGRVRSLNRATLESYFATEDARDTAQISLISEVASTYLAYAGDLELLKLARETLEAQERSYTLTKARFDAGASSMLDVRRAQTTVESARADVARYTALVAQDENALALLLGAPVPEALKPTTIKSVAFGAAALPPGLPSEVLLQRPDIRAAEHDLRAANANIGAARAAFFPSVRIAGSAGQVDARFENLFSGAAQTWAFTPSVTLPIFDGGARRGQLGVARADRDIAVARYEQSIQIAFREVADALADNGAIGRQIAAREALAEATGDAYRLSEARYRQGVDSYLSLLDSQRELYAAQQALVSARVAKAVNAVTLYKTLGGGA